MRRVILAIVTALVSSGCASYYRISDPASGKSYYTQSYQQQSAGAVSLKDARTGDTITLQNSDIHQISHEEFDSARSTSGVSMAQISSHAVAAEPTTQPTR